MLINCVKNLIMLASQKLVRDEIRKSGKGDVQGFHKLLVGGELLGVTPSWIFETEACRGRRGGHGGEGERRMGESASKRGSLCQELSLG